jgi:hypothetical protein
MANFIGEPAQLLHQDWTVDQIKLRYGRPGAIAKACFADNVLPIQRAQFEFGPTRVELAREQYETVPEAHTPTTPVDKHDLRPSCYGVLHAYEAGAPVCGSCTFRQGCELITAKVRELVIKKCGTADPVLARRRQLTRDRVNLHRARKKAIASSATQARKQTA